MSRGQPPSYGHYHHSQWQQPPQWQNYGPPSQQSPYVQPPLPTYHQHHQPYASPSATNPSWDQRHSEHSERKRSREESPAVSQAGLPPIGPDWRFTRQHILDNGEALMQNLCPTAYGPHNKGRYAVVLLLIMEDPKRWRAGLACDGQLVIEGPECSRKEDAMATLSEAIAARLAKCISRAWDDEDAEMGAEEHATGAKFASESQR